MQTLTFKNFFMNMNNKWTFFIHSFRSEITSTLYYHDIIICISTGKYQSYKGTYCIEHYYAPDT